MTLSPQDRGLLYGDGLFETILVRGSRAPLLPLHLNRLTTSAQALAIPLELDAIQAAIADHIESLPPGEHALRLTLSRGEPLTRGYAFTGAERPSLHLTSAPYQRPTSPMRAVTASIRVYSGSLLTRHKSLSALEKVIARTEAARARVDEALFLNEHGRPTEATSANLFAKVGGEWLTPPVSEGCLPGVMRQQVQRLLQAQERPLTLADLQSAVQLLLTNALIGALPLIELDGQRIGGEGPPPLPPDALWTYLPSRQS